MKTEKSKGIFIQIEIMVNKKLDWGNKALIQEIINLNNLKDGCYASDEHFANLLHISRQATNKRINQLENLGYIFIKKKIKEKYCVERIIKPNMKKISEECQIFLENNNESEWNYDVNNIPTSAAAAPVAPVEIIEELPVEIIEENNSIPTEKQQETILTNFEKFKLSVEIEKIYDSTSEEQEKEQELQNEIMKQKTIQSKLAEDIAKQKEKINNLKQQTGKTNKEMLDEHFVLTLPNWIEEYEDLGNSMFCRQYKNLITEDIKLIINQFERDLMFGRYAFTTEQMN